MPRMAASSLKALLAAERHDALSAISASKLSDERSNALDYYMGDMTRDMPAPEGRSRAVSTDVADTIEGLMPNLMEIFCAGDEVVKFAAVGAEDEAAAEQETDYVNHVFMQQNPGFLVLYSFIKDALLSKVGVVKVWWEKREETERETYYDLDEMQFAVINADPDVTVIAHTPHAPGVESEHQENAASESEGETESETEVMPDQSAGTESLSAAAGPHNAQPPQQINGAVAGAPLAPVMLHDVTVETKRKYERACAEAVPPEEFGISRHARSMREADYCYHDVLKTESKLIAQGYDAAQIKKLPSYTLAHTIEEQARDTVDESTLRQGEDGLNQATRLIRVTEHYVRMDYEGDGISQEDGRKRPGAARLYRVSTGGEDGEVLIRDGEPDVIEEDQIPFAAMTPVIITHRFFGRSVADLVMDIQRIKTALLRGMLDNSYMSNMPRPTVAEEDANENTIDDLLVARHGAPIRVKRNAQTAVTWQTVPNIGANVMAAIQYMDATREWRSGVSRQGQGVDPNALQNQVATIANQMYNASQAKVKLIARIFAETGIRDLFALLHGVIRKNGSQAQTVRLKNQWVEVDPRDWKKRNDMTIQVALGTGTKGEQLAHQQLIIGAQREAIGAGLVTKGNLYESAKELTRLGGHKDVDRFFMAPKPDEANVPIPPPQDPKMQIEQLKQQHDQQMEQIRQAGDTQAAQLKAQLEQQQMHIDTVHQAAKNQGEAALAERKFELDREMKLLDAQIELKKHDATMAFNAQKLALEHQHKLALAAVDERSAARKIHMEANAKVAHPGTQLDEAGNVAVHPELKSALNGLASSAERSHQTHADTLAALHQIATGIHDSHQQIMKAVTAKRVSTVHRDPKTKRVTHATHTVDGAP